ncbi:MAG: TolB protein, partial [Actinomycetota bacterium]|nr:TolB protein [Actinomycetota bacterium]
MLSDFEPGERTQVVRIAGAIGLLLAAAVAVIVVRSASSSGPAADQLQGRITFASTRDGNLEIYAMDATGRNQTRLTSNPTEDSYPDWSPDGSQIVFETDRDGNFDLYVMNADGSGQHHVTDSPASDQFGAWSPDGSKIAF